jgi:hypothetical protein
VRWHDGTPLPDGHYGTGIWSVFDSHTCCGRIAHNFIVIHGRRRWLRAPHFNAHIETRGFLRMEGENWDANGLPV